jgi:hypothetical protein
MLVVIGACRAWCATGGSDTCVQPCLFVLGLQSFLMHYHGQHAEWQTSLLSCAVGCMHVHGLLLFAACSAWNTLEESGSTSCSSLDTAEHSQASCSSAGAADSDSNTSCQHSTNNSRLGSKWFARVIAAADSGEKQAVVEELQGLLQQASAEEVRQQQGHRAHA